jgi:PPOX class probable F420-dependent enzyme
MATLNENQARLLRDRNFGVVATVREDGSPQLTPVWVDTDGEDLLFNTAEGRAKPRNLRRDPRLSVLVLDRDDDQRWLSVSGRAELSHEGAAEHIDQLAHKYRGRSYRLPAGQTRVIVRVRADRIESYGL